MKHSRENQSPDKLPGQSSDQSSGKSRPSSSKDEPAEKDERGFIGRWARRKQDAAVGGQEPLIDDVLNDSLNNGLTDSTDHALQQQGAPVEGVRSEQSTTIEDPPPAPLLTDKDMPDIETLNADSDFSPFLSKGVSKELRNLALKKLFFSGKFSARDGLDDYDDDFTKFEPLGDTITSDMKFHARRKEKARLAELEEERLRLESAEASANEELSEAETDESAVIADTEAEETEIASVDQSEDVVPENSGSSSDSKIADEPVTETASPKDNEPQNV